MKVTLTAPVNRADGGVHAIGTELELEEHAAQRLVRLGAAVPSPEPMPAPPPKAELATALEAAPEMAPPPPAEEARRVDFAKSTQRSTPRANSKK